MRLQNRVAVITGGGTGIGKAIATIFAAEGAAVAIASRNLSVLEATASEIKSSGGEACAIQTDVTDEKQIHNMVARTLAEYGKIDILVNDSAFMKPSSIAVADMPLDYWNDTLGVNLTGTMLCTRGVVRGMIKQKSGSIINISSMAGVAGSPNRSAYAASKSGVIRFTESLAIEVGQYNIRANSISPSATNSERWQEGQKARAEQLGVSYEEVFEKTLRQYPLKRIPEPSEVAKAALFLASDDSSAITGLNVIVSCGFHLLHPA